MIKNIVTFDDPLRDRTTCNNNQKVSLVSSEPEKPVQNSTSATTNSNSINKADFPAQLAYIYVNELWREKLKIMPQDVMGDIVEDEFSDKDIENEVPMFCNEWDSETR